MVSPGVSNSTKTLAKPPGRWTALFSSETVEGIGGDEYEEILGAKK